MSKTQQPSLTSLAVIASIVTGKPQMTKKDKEATENAERSMGAHDAGNYIKQLYPKALVTPITATEGALRNYVRSVSMPYGRNQYLVPQSLLMEVMPRVQDFLVQHKQAVTAFANNFSNVLINAQQQQGGMFDPSLYPDVSDVVEQFKLDVEYYPVPAAVQFRALSALEKNFADNLTETLEKRTDETRKACTREAFARLAEQVETIAEQVSKRLDRDRVLFADPGNTSAKKQGRIYDSLIDNLDHLIKTLPALNFDNDPNLNAMIDACREKLSIHPDILREDSAINEKERVVKDAKDILAQMKGFI